MNKMSVNDTDQKAFPIYNVFNVLNAKQDNVCSTCSKNEAFTWFEVLLSKHKRLYKAYCEVYSKCKNVSDEKSLTREQIDYIKLLFDSRSYSDKTRIRANTGCIWISYVDAEGDNVALAMTGTVDHPLQVLGLWLYNLKEYPEDDFPN